MVCAGAAPAPEPVRKTPTSWEKDADHRPLHPAARRCNGHLCRRVGPVILCTFAPAPDWSPDGHRIKSELDYSREPEKTWVYGALRVRDGQQITMTASSRNSVFCQQFLQLVEDANPTGEIWIVTDNLSFHNSLSTRTWLEDHPRIRHVFIPVGACWLNLQEGWWRIFCKTALAGRSFANSGDIVQAIAVATAQFNALANPGSGVDQPHPPANCDGDIATVFAFAGDQIRHIWVVGNPEKLRPWRIS